MAAKSQRERVTTVLFYGVLLLLAWLVFRIFQPFLVPLGWAAVFVVVFYPLHERLERRMNPNAAAALSTAAVTLILIVPALLLGAAFVQEGIEAVRNIQTAVAEGRLPWVQRGWEWLAERAPVEGPRDLATLAREGAERVAGFLASQVGAVVRNVTLFFFYLVVTIFAMFYLFRDAGKLTGGIRRALPFDKPQRERMIAQARDLIHASVTSSLIIAALQGFLGGLAFALLGIGAPIFWGVVMAFFSLLPLVGAWIVWGPAAVWLIVNGQWVKGVVLIGLGAGVVGTVDNFLRPALISGRARLSGLVVFISVLGGIAVFGMLGVVLGPIVVATAAGLFEVYTKEEPPPAPPGAETVGPGARAVLE